MRLLRGSALEWYLLVAMGVTVAVGVFMIVHGALGGTWADLLDAAAGGSAEASWGERWLFRAVDAAAPPLVWGATVVWVFMPGAAWLLVRMHEKWRWC